MAVIRAFGTEGKVKGLSSVLAIEVVAFWCAPETGFFSASLNKALNTMLSVCSCALNTCSPTCNRHFFFVSALINGSKVVRRTLTIIDQLY